MTDNKSNDVAALRSILTEYCDHEHRELQKQIDAESASGCVAFPEMVALAERPIEMSASTRRHLMHCSRCRLTYERVLAEVAPRSRNDVGGFNMLVSKDIEHLGSKESEQRMLWGVAHELLALLGEKARELSDHPSSFAVPLKMTADKTSGPVTFAFREFPDITEKIDAMRAHLQQRTDVAPDEVAALIKVADELGEACRPGAEALTVEKMDKVQRDVLNLVSSIS